MFVGHIALSVLLQLSSFLEDVLKEASKPKRRCSAPVEAPSVRQQVAQLHDRPTQVLDIEGVKPRQALALLKQQLQGSPTRRTAWLDDARVAAVVGSCPRSRASFNSGCRHWIEFIEITCGVENCDRFAMPPHLDHVLAWSNTFQCLGRFSDRIPLVLCMCCPGVLSRNILQLFGLFKGSVSCFRCRGAAC